MKYDIVAALDIIHTNERQLSGFEGETPINEAIVDTILRQLELSGIVLKEDTTYDLKQLKTLGEFGKKVTPILLESLANDNKGFTLNSFHVNKFTKAMQLAEEKYGKDCWDTLEPKGQDLIAHLQSTLATKDPEQLQQFLLDYYQKDPLYFGKLIMDIFTAAEMRGDLFNYDNESNIAAYLIQLKVGVCRHYSMIAKKIYEATAPDLFPDSELLYVCNHATKHAYNLLLYENEKGEIEKQYIDITLFITADFLLRDEKDVLAKNAEYWANQKRGNDVFDIG